MSYDPEVAIPERNRQILQMRKEGVQRIEVARRFNLSPGRIEQIEKKDAVDKATAERRAKLREAIRSADDPDKVWRVKDQGEGGAPGHRSDPYSTSALWCLC